MSMEKAVDELKKNSGTQFDPGIVNVFLEIIEKEEDWMVEVMKKTPVVFLEEIKDQITNSMIEAAPKKIELEPALKKTDQASEQDQKKTLQEKKPPGMRNVRKGTVEIRDLIKDAKKKLLLDLEKKNQAAE